MIFDVSDYAFSQWIKVKAKGGNFQNSCFKKVSTFSLQAIQPILWKYGKSAEFELFRGSKEVPFSRNFECE